MMMVRSLIFKAAFMLATFLWSTLILMMLVLPFKWRHHIGTFWADTVIWLARVICGIRWEIHGHEHIPDQACILVVNHQSNWETFFTTLLQRKQVWLLKKELVKMPYVGWAMNAMGPVAIDRKQGREALRMLMEEGKQRLDSGYSLVIYPEGTRSAVDAPQPFKVGAGRLAHDVGVPVIPIAHNASQFWPKRGCMHSGTVQVIVGEPINIEGKSAKEINEMAETWISSERSRIVNAEKARRGEAIVSV